ncbi:MAG: hypothetical protein KBA05_02490 [Anaerolineaceae bacterium]|jgi:hypothetical protein|nr:hypothetical protein [Anaerolineaceae bacterium]MDI9530709.1 DUF5706 domain-containing protein [Chloroflexota bacterium]
MDEKQGIDVLEFQVDLIQHLIERADTKASILLAFLGVILAISINQDAFLRILTTNFLEGSNHPPLLLLIMVCLSFVSFSISFVFVVLTLRARLHIEQIGLTPSIFYFETISKYEAFDEFKAEYEKITNPKTQLLKEIYNNSKICALKYKYFNYSLSSLVFGVVLQLCAIVSISLFFKGLP